MPIPENNVRFTDLSNGTVKAGSIFATSEPDSSTPPSYDSTKVTAQAVGNFVATSQTYSGLSTVAKTLVGAINEAAQGGGGSSTPLVVNGTVEEGETYGVLYGGETVTTFDAAWMQNRMSVLMVDNFMGIEENELILTYVGKIYISSLNVYDHFFVINQTDNNGQPVMNVVRMRQGDLTSGYQKFYCYSFSLMDKKEVSGTLTAGSTSITLSDAAITSSSTIDIYTDTYGVNPTAVTVSTGSVTMTFESQANNVSVKVRIS